MPTTQTTTAAVIISLEWEIAGLLTSATWDPADNGDVECIVLAQSLVNDWCKAVAA